MYTKKQLLLMEKIDTFLLKFKKKVCKFDNKLKQLFCKFFFYKDFKVGEVLGKGINGEVFDAGIFEGIPIVIKHPIEFDERNINEVYINVVLINSLLLKYPFLENYLVPTYGIFICPAKNKKLKSLCKIKKSVHLVQKKIFGDTLYNLETNMSLKTFKKIISDIFVVLCILEDNSVYHKDLHTKNVIIEKDTNHPYIIDFGYAYGEMSGFYDALSLFGHQTNKELSSYCNSILKKLCDDLQIPFFESRRKFKKYDYSLNDEDYKSLHNKLSKITYKYIQTLL